MQRLFIVLGLLLACTLLLATPVTDALSLELETTTPNQPIRVLIRLADQYDSQMLLQATRGMNRDDRRAYVVNELQSFCAASQAPVLRQLESWQNKGQVTRVRSMWIANIIACEATPGAIVALAADPRIERIDLDEERQLLNPAERRGAFSYSPRQGSRDIAWNVTHVNADDAWSQGYRGAGVLVAVIDTGVNYNHNDLADHVWNGGSSYPYHGYDFHNDDNNPMDDDGHGTHCAGTVAGDGTAGTQTGMAPDATIMALKVLGNDGSGYESNVLDAIQFAVNHGADVISMSLGWQHDWGPDRESWRDSFVNVLAAGMVAAVAAGNEGDELSTYPIPDNVRTPGDCPPPWLHPDQTLTGGLSAVVCVGASDINDDIGYFSSLGPCTWSGITSYNDYTSGIRLIRPDVNAPGVSITSLDYSDTSGYEAGWNGTSMATPCVAGIMALLLSKNPNLTPAEIDQYLELNSDVQPTTKNNTFGAGRVNALSALNAVPAGTDPPNAATNPSPANGEQNAAPPNRLTWSNGGGAAQFTVYVGTSNGAPWDIVNGQTATSPYMDVTGMQFDQTYYWRVDSYNAYGAATGSVWSFHTCPAPDEDFETGDFTLYSWSTYGDSNWSVNSAEAYSGIYSAVTGNITHNQSTSLSLTLTALASGDISFAQLVSTEDNYDFFRFYIDDVLQDEWSGNLGWQIVSFPVTAGTHTFEWEYEKDVSASYYDDCVRLDYIFLPPHGTPEPNIVIDTTSLDFGNISTGTTSTLPFTIENTGVAPLQGSIVTPTAYTVSQNRQNNRNALGFSIPTGSSETFQLTFAPPAVGGYSGTMVVTSDDPDSPTVNITVYGTASAPPQIAVQPGSIYTTMQQNSTDTHTLSVGNTGVADLEYTATVSYSAGTRDVLVESSFETAVPPAGWSVEINNGTVPWEQSSLASTTGSYSALADWNGTYDTRLITPEFTGTSDCQLTYYIRTLDDPDYGGDFDVEVSVDGGDWVSLATYDQDTFTQTFSLMTMDLSAYNGQNIRVAFRAWNNYWADGVFLDDVMITGTDIPDGWLSLNNQQSVQGTVASGGTDAISVVCSSGDMPEDTYYANIHVASNDPTTPAVDIPVSMTVSTGIPQIAVLPASCEFGPVVVGTTNSMPFTIQNPGTATLSGSIVTPVCVSVVAGSRVQVARVSRREEVARVSLREAKQEALPFSRNTLAFSIAAGQSQVYDLTYTPDAMGNYSNVVTISHNAGSDVQVPVTGEGQMPIIGLSVDSLYVMQEADTVQTRTVTVTNSGTSDLTWNVQQSTGRAQGGPDTFGYVWSDSNEPGGPVYAWEDITSSGIPIAFTDDDSLVVALPFSIPFYDVDFTTVKISSNGYLTFGELADEYTNQVIPVTANPNSIIAPMWDDYKPIGVDGSYDWGTVYYLVDTVNQRLIVQYQDVAHWSNSSPLYYDTFEVIVKSTGEILYQYNEVQYPATCTVGIENHDGTDGLQIAYNQTYLTDLLAIRILPPSLAMPWLTASPDSGVVPPGQQEVVTLSIDSTGLDYGQYSANIVFGSDDPTHPAENVPVVLQVEYLPEPPANLQLDLQIAQDQLVLRWDPVPGATMYTLYYSENGIDFYYMMETADTTMTINNIDVVNKVYFYVTVK